MKTRALILLCVTGLLTGCGKKESAPASQEPTPAAPTPSKSPSSPVDANESRASVISGVVKFKGTPPPRKQIKLEADPVCAGMHQQPLQVEDVIVNADGTLRNVIIYVKEGLGARKFPVPTQPVVLDQQGCMYHPHVFGMQAGQPLVIQNSDDTPHNITASPQNRDKGFNIGQPMKGTKQTRTFDQAEVAIAFSCQVHPWMNAHAGVFDHPFFGVTGDGGTFGLKNLPAGEYVIEAWHEKYGTLSQTVKVEKDATQTIEFTFERK